MAIQFLRGNKSTLDASQQIFLPGQPIYEQDSGQLKIGNGSDIYSALKYVGASSSAVFSDAIQTGTTSYRYMDIGDTRLIVGSWTATPVLGLIAMYQGDNFSIYSQIAQAVDPLWAVADLRSNLEVLDISLIHDYNFANIFVSSVMSFVDTVQVRISAILQPSRVSVADIQTVTYNFTVLTYD